MRRKRSLTQLFPFPAAALAAALLMVLLLLTTASCRRELEVYYHQTARVKLEVDWLSRVGTIPNGMTLFIYHDGDAWPTIVPTNEVNERYLDLEEGLYRLVIINKSMDEFPVLQFLDVGSYFDFATRARNIATRNRSWDADTLYMYDPDPIASATDSFRITPEMIRDRMDFVNYKHRTDDRYQSYDSTLIIRYELPEPLITKVYAQIRVGGIDNASTCEAALWGMADGCYISQVWRTRERGTLYLSEWRGLPTRADNGDGWIYAETATFGLPHGLEPDAARDSTSLHIALNFGLRDGSTRLYQYNVGMKVAYRGGISSPPTKQDVRREIELIIDIPDYPRLPDVDDDGRGSGFTAEVSPWDDGGTIDLGTY